MLHVVHLHAEITLNLLYYSTIINMQCARRAPASQNTRPFPSSIKQMIKIFWMPSGGIFTVRNATIAAATIATQCNRRTYSVYYNVAHRVRVWVCMHTFTTWDVQYSENWGTYSTQPQSRRRCARAGALIRRKCACNPGAEMQRRVERFTPSFDHGNRVIVFYILIQATRRWGSSAAQAAVVVVKLSATGNAGGRLRHLLMSAPACTIYMRIHFQNMRAVQFSPN